MIYLHLCSLRKRRPLHMKQSKSSSDVDLSQSVTLFICLYRKSSSFIGTVTPWSPRKGTFSPSTQQVQPLLASTIAGAWITAGLLAPPRRVLPHDWTSSGKYGDLMQKFGKEGGHTCCSFGDSRVCLTGAPVLLATSVTGKEDSKVMKRSFIFQTGRVCWLTLFYLEFVFIVCT